MIVVRIQLSLCYVNGECAAVYSNYPGTKSVSSAIVAMLLATWQVTVVPVRNPSGVRADVADASADPIDVAGKIADHQAPRPAEGKLKPVIDRSYPLSDIVEALRHVDEGRARGKVVITL